jgi:hypothetical protein
MRKRIRTLSVLALAIGAGVAIVPAQVIRHIDVENRFTNVGAMIVWVEPNGAGVPQGFSPPAAVP